MGSIDEVPNAALNGDSKLTPGEEFDHSFSIDIETIAPLTFFVEAFRTEVP